MSSNLSDAIDMLRHRISQVHNVLIAAHLDPDGDTLGSCLGLAIQLRSMGLQVLVVCHDPIPSALDILPGQEHFLGGHSASADLRLSSSFELAIAVDAGDVERLGSFGEMVMKCPIVANIDHHPTNPMYGNINIVDPQSSSTAELVFKLLSGWEKPLEEAAATALYIGLMTDTGSFRYANTNDVSLKTAAELVACGAKPAVLAEAVYERRSFGFLKLLGFFLLNMETANKGRVVWSCLSMKDLEDYGVEEDEVDGLAGYLRMSRGCDVAVVFKEAPDDKVKVSLRSRESVDVSEIALSLGGGGHKRASGATVLGTLSEVKAATISLIQKAMDVGGN